MQLILHTQPRLSYKMYKLTKENNGVIRLSDNAYIPFDPQNVDYQAYLQWLEQGNVPTPANEGVA